MKVAFFHLVACFVLGVVLAAEEEKPPEPNWWQKILLFIDDVQTKTSGSTANSKAGDECVVSAVCHFPSSASGLLH